MKLKQDFKDFFPDEYSEEWMIDDLCCQGLSTIRSYNEKQKKK